MKNRILLIDGSYLLFKSFYSSSRIVASGGHAVNLQTRSGFPTNAIHVFLRTLLRLTRRLQITHLLIAYDAEEKSFRHKMYSEYKAKRQSMPEELCIQVPIIKQIWTQLNIAWIEKDGIEADDIIATYVDRFSRSDDNIIYIFSGDKDLGQLVSGNVHIINVHRGRMTMVHKDNFHKLEAMHPWQVCDYKALAGDASDNIPGVAGIGRITARRLLASYDNLEGIYQNIQLLPKRVRELLEPTQIQVYETREFVRLVVDPSLFPDDIRSRFRLNIRLGQAEELLKEYELFGIIRSLRSRGLE